MEFKIENDKRFYIVVLEVSKIKKKNRIIEKYTEDLVSKASYYS
jgi:hypothetical protein